MVYYPALNGDPAGSYPIWLWIDPSSSLGLRKLGNTTMPYQLGVERVSITPDQYLFSSGLRLNRITGMSLDGPPTVRCVKADLPYPPDAPPLKHAI
jgi:hypothetical protein